MANKTANTKHKPVRRALRANEYYNPKTKRYEYHYIDAFGKKRVVSSYILEATDQVPKGKRAGQPRHIMLIQVQVSSSWQKSMR